MRPEKQSFPVGQIRKCSGQQADQEDGQVEAVCTSPTRIVDEVKVVINQAAPTDCIKVPIFETIFAAQIARKAGKASGANSESVASREG